MGIHDVGVASGSKIWFSEPSSFAKRNLFYLTEAGRYICTPEYVYTASNLPTSILLVIDEGHLYIKLDGFSQRRVKQGEAVIFNREIPHTYNTDGPMKMRYLVLAGLSTFEYVDAIIQKKGLIWSLKSAGQCNKYINAALNMIEGRVDNEHAVSCNLHRLLSEIMMAEREEFQESGDSLVYAVEYLHQHWNEHITLNDMARAAHFSTCYFAKQFKRWKGVSPYEYVIQIRLDEAKRLLCTTKQDVGRIAVECGFDSSSHLIYHFRSRLGITPAAFRRQRHEAEWENVIES